MTDHYKCLIQLLFLFSICSSGSWKSYGQYISSYFGKNICSCKLIDSTWLDDNCLDFLGIGSMVTFQGQFCIKYPLEIKVMNRTDYPDANNQWMTGYHWTTFSNLHWFQYQIQVYYFSCFYYPKKVWIWQYNDLYHLSTIVQKSFFECYPGHKALENKWIFKVMRWPWICSCFKPNTC